MSFFLLLGKLVLSVTKDTYEQLGLQGVQSRYQDHRYGETASERGEWSGVM